MPESAYRHLFCYKKTLVPSDLKVSNIIPIFKQGDRHQLTNYRPILILSYIAKIMEKAMTKRLTHYVEKLEILSSMQVGFRKQHTTEMALIKIQDLITSAIDSKKYSVGIVIDLAKAFDPVDHGSLIK